MTESPWPHRFAWLLLAATALLLLSGGKVTTYGVGMAVPDAPRSFGENMFTYDFLGQSVGVVLEHSHRLLASAIGLLTLVLLVVTFWSTGRQAPRLLATVLVVGVCLQGLLGMSRVELNKAGWGTQLALAHGVTAQMFFALVAAMVVVTGRRFPAAAPVRHPQAGVVRGVAVALVPATLLQVFCGAAVRHFGQLFWLHAALATAVFFGVLYVATIVALHPPLRRVCGRAAGWLTAVLVGQVALGLAAMLLTGLQPPALAHPPGLLEAWVVTLHLVLGAAFFGAAVWLALATRSLASIGAVVESPDQTLAGVTA